MRWVNAGTRGVHREFRVGLPGKVSGETGNNRKMSGGWLLRSVTYRKHNSLSFSFPPMSAPPTPLSAGTRKHKVPPALPLSVFTPPATGTADRFPFPPSPTSVTAESIVDANVVVTSTDLTQWISEATSELKAKISGVVLLVKADDVQQLVEKCVSDDQSLSTPSETDLAPRLEPRISDIPILSVSVPFSTDNGSPVGIPSSSKIPISLSVVYSRQTPEVVNALTWALSNGHIVDVDVQFSTDDKSYDSLEESLSTASKDANPESAIVICSCFIGIPPAVRFLTFPRSERITTSGRFVPPSR